MSAIDFLIVPMGEGQDAFKMTHEPCGEQLLVTQSVHLSTLDDLSESHVCAWPLPPCPDCGRPLGLYYAECLTCFANAYPGKTR